MGKGKDTLRTSSSWLLNSSAEINAVALGLGMRSVGEPPVPHARPSFAGPVVAAPEVGAALDVGVGSAGWLLTWSAASMTMALAPELLMRETVYLR